jgi:hypothetical protein
MRDHPRQELAIAALTMAIRRQRPGRGLSHHSEGQSIWRRRMPAAARRACSASASAPGVPECPRHARLLRYWRDSDGSRARGRRRTTSESNTVRGVGEAAFLAMQRIVGGDERALGKLTKRQE